MANITKRFDKNNFSINALPFLLNGDNFSPNHTDAPSRMTLNIKFRSLSIADSPRKMALTNSCRPVQ